jgi:hypothetical protein
MPKEQIPQHLALLRDPTASDEQKLDACWTVYTLGQNIDRRKVVPVIIKLLDSPNEKLRRMAATTLGHIDSKRAVKPLLKISTNRSEPLDMRTEALRALSFDQTDQTSEVFRSLMFDTSENVEVRSMAIEWYPRNEGEAPIALWISLLADDLPDVRFWAAYRLSQAWTDLSAAISALDRVAAYDHAVPQTWGWHVDREALLPLEQFYSVPYRRKKYDDPDVGNLPSYGMYLVSPAIEYWDFSQMHRRRHEDGTYETPPDHPVHLKLEADWLKTQIGLAWAEAAFNVRQPKPQTYLLDWYLQIDGQDLLGGLHRDQYGVVLSGKYEAVCAFAAWYRSVIAPEHRLYLYEWADPGAELTPGMTGEQAAQALKAALDAWTYDPAKFQ